MSSTRPVPVVTGGTGRGAVARICPGSETSTAPTLFSNAAAAWKDMPHGRGSKPTAPADLLGVTVTGPAGIKPGPQLSFFGKCLNRGAIPLDANPNAGVRKPFRDTAGLDGIRKVMHKSVDPYPPLASRADRLLTLERECFAIKVCAGVWGVAAAHVRAIHRLHKNTRGDGVSWQIFCKVNQCAN